MRIAVAVALALLAAACGGAGPAATTEAVGTSAGGATPTASGDPSDSPTERPAGADTSDTEATPEPPSDAPSAAPAATLTLDPGDLAGRGYTLVVETGDGTATVAGALDDAGAGLALDGIEAADVTAVSVHAGDGPSAAQVWTGPAQEGSAELSAVLPADLAGASGQYILATPTDGPDSNENSGVWYVLIPRAPGLVLPVLESGWTYEGWVTVDGVDLSTGRFADPATPDDFDGFSGPEPSAPPLPGEDFLVAAPAGVTFPLDLSGTTTFVTVEPADDPHPGPSGLTILSGTVPDPAADHTVYDLTSAVDQIPALTATIS